MGNKIGQLGQLLFQERFDFGQIGDAGHHIEGLPAAIMFAQQRLAQGDGIKFADIGADGQTVDWWRADDRQVAHAGQAKLQGARDRRGGQGQHVNIRAHRLQTFFVTHAKVLFFINNQQAEVLELDRLCQQRVGAHHHIDGAAIDAVAGGCGLFRGDKTRQLTHLKREASEAFGEGFIVLTCQQGRRRDNRHLQP